ncbi:MAG: hypothetical protein ACJAQ4_000809 [Cryomorphaceae bacterium]|jgi:hypothetical protein
MRYSILFFMVLFFGASCNLKKEVTTAEATVAPDTVIVLIDAPSPKDSLAVHFEKTPCFGRCPVFKIKVYKSGFATYEGLNFAEKMGLYSYRFSEADLDKIYEMANAINYFDLESEYNDPRVTDLPATISEIQINDQTHTVNARMGVPQSLKDFHENLGIMLNERDWKPYSIR